MQFVMNGFSEELLIHICSFISVIDLARVGGVNQNFLQLSLIDSLWIQLHKYIDSSSSLLPLHGLRHFSVEGEENFYRCMCDRVTTGKKCGKLFRSRTFASKHFRRKHTFLALSEQCKGPHARASVLKEIGVNRCDECNRTTLIRSLTLGVDGLPLGNGQGLGMHQDGFQTCGVCDSCGNLLIANPRHKREKLRLTRLAEKWEEEEQFERELKEWHEKAVPSYLSLGNDELRRNQNYQKNGKKKRKTRSKEIKAKKRARRQHRKQARRKRNKKGKGQ
eukprot:g5318.t1